ncbi:MAG: hypothetical protein WBW33_35390, partial [Bryobacteraceae bacterium]
PEDSADTEPASSSVAESATDTVTPEATSAEPEVGLSRSLPPSDTSSLLPSNITAAEFNSSVPLPDFENVPEVTSV